jgi:heme-degrading monooxygenase HmoA
MSVVVTMKVKGDTAQFRSVLETESERLRGLAAQARAAGCIHHRFAVGDGFVLVVDEWDSAEAFQGFISSPEIAQVMGDMGARSEPEVEIGEAVESPDQF